MTNEAMRQNGVQFAIAQALSEATPVDEEQLDELALLQPMEYQQVRKRVADEWKISVRVLDKAVDDRKKQLIPPAIVGNGRPLEMPTIVLADAPVNGTAVFNMVVTVLSTYILLPGHAAAPLRCGSCARIAMRPLRSVPGWPCYRPSNVAERPPCWNSSPNWCRARSQRRTPRPRDLPGRRKTPSHAAH